MKRGSELAGMTLPDLLQLQDRPKPAFTDFPGVDDYFPIGRTQVGFDMLPKGFPACGKLHEKLQLSGDPQLLLELPVGAGEIILSGIHMARRRRIPVSRIFIFGHGTFLEKQITLGIEYQNMNRAVQQALGMDFSPGGLADNPVFGIHDIKYFRGIVHSGKR